ncbi:alginate export family protein [Novilysobacter selenitireducens]|uniref:Alginate export family protein n=1 Tax=Novilysobacter selenitireducens TaxID=2872639 RepID=A0ABS7T7Z5_9GAMM|nr:alginate export family protein [Lysobacter selenitireducens]MBZ4039995.1 alginate export family protein [Lysobacter selenitireducens]
MSVLPALLILATAALPAARAQPGTATDTQPVTWDAALRLRHEHVDDDAFSQPADATTLRLRVGLGARFAPGWEAYAQGEATAALHDAYNSTANGKGTLPVVADPQSAELNQAWLAWTGNRGHMRAGRQRVVLDNQRWVGPSAWRQNEQTFDAVAGRWQATPAMSVAYAWLDRVHRVNTRQALDPLARDRALDSHVAEIEHKRGDRRAGAYLVLHRDLDQPGASTRTYGARWAVDRIREGAGWKMALDVARQDEHGDNPGDFSHAYWRIEPAIASRGLTVGAGWEHLGGDGRHALQAPLGTLHAFNGWADMFLVTPAGGLDDRFASVGGRFPQQLGAHAPTWVLAYHDYRADTGGGYGREVDASVSVPVSPFTSVLLKLADYQSRGFRSDTWKMWLQLEWSR